MMKIAVEKRVLQVVAAIALTAGFISPASLAADKTKLDGQYVCAVNTEAGETAVVFLQARDIDRAKQMVLNSSVKTMSGLVATSTDIIQCITQHQETFSDSGIQKFYETMPR